MDESQNGDEDILSFLQPLTMLDSVRDEFTFESRTGHFEDSSDANVDRDPTPSPAVPSATASMNSTASAAPMADKDAMDEVNAVDVVDAVDAVDAEDAGNAVDATDPVVAVVPGAKITESEGVATILETETNGNKDDETVAEQDSDAIEYEKPKLPRKSPATRPTRSHATSKARKFGDEQSPRESGPGLLNYFSSSSVKRRGEANPKPESDLETNGGSQVKTGKRKSRETRGSEDVDTEQVPESLKFEVVIQPLPPAAAQEYTRVAPGDEVYRVLDVIKTGVPGEEWFSVEFEDGRVDQVSRSCRPGLFFRINTFTPKPTFLTVTQVESHQKLPSPLGHFTFTFHPLHSNIPLHHFLAPWILPTARLD
jgi:hypothetical protein